MHAPFVWGSLSTANIGRQVLPAIAAGRGMVLGAVASRDGARAKAYAAELGFDKSYDSYEALLADPDIDAIYNPLPNDMHVPWTIKAMEAGKHVLCEKPIAMDAKEAELLRDAQRRTGKFVVEAFMVRHHPQWLRTRERVRAGEIGTVRAIQTFFCYNNTEAKNIRNIPAHGGGGLYDIGCYAIATSRFMFEADPVRVAAIFDTDPEFGTDRLASAIMEFPGGRHLTFTCSTQLAAHQRVTICGEAGRLEVLVPFNAAPDESMQILYHDGRDLLGRNAQIERFDPVNQYTLQGEAFAALVRDGDPADLSAVEDAIMQMRVIDALFRSGKSGQLETV